jgi:hypothetical protein
LNSCRTGFEGKFGRNAMYGNETTEDERVGRYDKRYVDKKMQAEGRSQTIPATTDTSINMYRDEEEEFAEGLKLSKERRMSLWIEDLPTDNSRFIEDAFRKTFPDEQFSVTVKEREDNIGEYIIYFQQPSKQL